MCPLFSSQLSTAPVSLLRQSASLLPSLLKSPLPASCHALDTIPTPVPPLTWPLLISQLSTSPLAVLRQRMSEEPSALRSFCAGRTSGGLVSIVKLMLLPAPGVSLSSCQLPAITIIEASLRWTFPDALNVAL